MFILTLNNYYLLLLIKIHTQKNKRGRDVI